MGTEWQGLEPLGADSPAEALPEFDALVERMMGAHGYPVDQGHAFEVPEEEAVKEFVEARRITRLFEAGEPVDPGSVPPFAGYRNVHDYVAGALRHLVRRRRPPLPASAPGRRFARPPPRGDRSRARRTCL